MATRLVRGACPHDCPDTCAMHVTVEDGRATKVAGDPDHPITVGFLCGKVSNYLDRVYSDERILHPLVREGGELPARLVGRGDRLAARGAAPRARRVRRRVDPAVQLHGHAGADPGQHDVRPGDERARRLESGAHDLRHRRLSSGPRWLTASRPRWTPRSGRTRATCWCGAGTRSPRRRTCGESCSTRARRARGWWWSTLPQPHRAGGGRAPAAAAGHRRRAGDRDDAGDRGRRPPRRGLVPGAHRRLRRAARGAGPHERGGVRGDLRGRRRGDRASGARVRLHAAGSPAPRRGRPAPRRRPGRLLDDRVAARAHRRLEGPRRGLLVHPARHRRRDQLASARARGPARATGAHDQHVAARRGAHGPGSRPAGEGARVLELEPGGDRARSGAGARGPPPATTSSRSCSSSS